MCSGVHLAEEIPYYEREIAFPRVRLIHCIPHVLILGFPQTWGPQMLNVWYRISSWGTDYVQALP